MATPPLGGTGLRGRSGIDGKQEAGGEAVALFERYENFALTGEASWKRSLHPPVALLAEAGASYARYGGTIRSPRSMPVARSASSYRRHSLSMALIDPS